MPDTRIVTTAYRPKRPPKKRKAVAIAGPVIVRKAKATKGVHTADTPKPGQAVKVSSREDTGQRWAPPPAANDGGKPEPLPIGGKKSALVTARRPGARRVNVPDLTPEEHQRRGDAADALWRELVRRATAKDQP
jgi:hypothetical protein